MFQPQLGVSLHTLSESDTLTDELMQAVSGSPIATLEIWAGLCDGDGRAHKVAMLQGMFRHSHVRAATIHAPFGTACDLSALDDGAARDALRAVGAAVDLAVELGAPTVVVHASAEPVAPQERRARLERARAALSELGRQCRATGRRAAVELLPRTCLGNTVEELLALLDSVGGEVSGVCLDTNHLMNRYRNLAGDVRRFGERLIALHLSDYDGIDEKHELPGRGVLDWAAFMRALYDIDYRGPFNYECRLDGNTPQERIRTLEENYSWLSRLR